MLDGFQPLLGNKSIMAISHDQGGQTALQWMNSLPMEHPAFIDHFPTVNPSKTRISHSLRLMGTSPKQMELCSWENHGKNHGGPAT
jgi:hypothetical protein